ncbi:ClpP/crotonase-like domain-containing protein [Aspergillus alliaceus]|uniref:ClpP/crotonase-like domain-containing protein n=1 Tax=Petromyces alliaceus TaxID=209559 RepID=A0A5N7C632_PETAA|nr:ClpP/crotonase-like domain-containing protein [Aspergillus alliaceus]
MALFTRSVSSGAYFICAMPLENVYFLVFESPPDNNLSPSFLDTFASCLQTIKESYPPGVLVTASRNPHSYCRDVPSNADEQWERQAWPLLTHILTYPMPTIAFINGRAVGLGFLFALCHDFRIQARSKSTLCMCENPSTVNIAPRIDLIKAILPRSTVNFSAFANGNPLHARESLKRGLVDKIGHVEEIFEFIKDRKLLEAARAPAYSESKMTLKREAIRVLDSIKMGRYSTGRCDSKRLNAGCQAQTVSFQEAPALTPSIVVSGAHYLCLL